MKRYVIRRLLMAIPLLLAISFVCFVFINLIPSNPAEVVLRIQQTPIITDEAIAEMEEALGLNKPFLVRYFDWVLGCLQGDFGISYVNPARTVAGELARCLPATLQLAAASFVIVLLLSIPKGWRPNRLPRIDELYLGPFPGVRRHIQYTESDGDARYLRPADERAWDGGGIAEQPEQGNCNVKSRRA